MKKKMLAVLVLSAVIITAFTGVMVQAKDNGTFYIEDIEGERDYIDLFSLEGIAGDATHSMYFRLKNGELSTEYYPVSALESQNIFYAQRSGETGLDKFTHSPSYFAEGWEYYSFYCNSAPAAGAKTEAYDGIDPEAGIAEAYGGLFSATSGNTVKTDRVEIYLDMDEFESSERLHIPTGIVFEDDFYYVNAETEDGRGSSLFTSLESLDMRVYGEKVGEYYYAMVIPGRDSRFSGETSLFRFTSDDLAKWEIDEAPYSDEQRGSAEAICTFPIDEGNRILAMSVMGESGIGVFRMRESSIVFSFYDLEGRLISEDICSELTEGNVDQMELERIDWDDGSVSLTYRCYTVEQQEDNVEVWNLLEQGIYQADDGELKRLKGGEEGGMLTACRSNLVLSVGQHWDEENIFPYGNYQELYFTVYNGDTEKVLYRGRLVTDFKEDLTKEVSMYDISKSTGYLEERIGSYYESDVYRRERTVMCIEPIDGKREAITWWR